MSTIRKRGSKYQVQIRRTGYETISKTFDQKSQALEWSRLMEGRSVTGELSYERRILYKLSVRQLVIDYLNTQSTKKRNNERHIIQSFMNHPISLMTVGNFKASDYHRYKKFRLKHVKPATFNRELTVIHHAFNVAIKELGIPLKNNPLSNVVRPPVKGFRERRLNDGELDLIIHHLDDTKNVYMKYVILFALETGMRRGEIMNMHWKHVNTANRTLYIPTTKTGYPRTIPLSTKALEVLKQLNKTMLDKEDNVFPITGNAIKLSWRRLMDRAGIVDLRFHDLRVIVSTLSDSYRFFCR